MVEHPPTPRRRFLTVNGVTKTFQMGADSVQALRSVNLTIDKGEFVCLIGASGCGKSTLLRIIAGFEQPTSGAVSLYENAITAPGSDRGMVFQDYALFPWMTVRENISFGPRQKGMAKKYVDQITDEYLNMVGLAKFAQRFPQQLSGGMKQRVAIARVLANECEVLLMDEPFGALDAQTRSAMQDLLLQVLQTENKTVMLITHSVDEAIYLSGRIIVVSARPAQIRADIRVPFPYPRPPGIADTPEFAQLRSHIRELVMQEYAVQIQQGVRLSD